MCVYFRSSSALEETAALGAEINAYKSTIAELEEKVLQVRERE